MNKLKLYLGIYILFGSGIFAAEAAKVSSLLFMHYSYEDTDNNGFGIKRAYLTYENSLNQSVSYKFQVDVGSTITDVKSDFTLKRLDHTVYLKNAKVDWKTGLGKFTIGLQGMNMFKVQEATWGFRFIDKMAMDLNGFSSSADMGIAWDNKFGPLSANLMITNGCGYKQAENDGHKKVSFLLHVGQSKLKKGFNAGIVMSHEGLDYGSNSTGSSLVLGGFGGLVIGNLRAGIEYELQNISSSQEKTSTLVSAYSTLGLRKDLDTYIRIDYHDDDNKIVNDTETYLIAGINYLPEPSFSVAPNIRMNASDMDETELKYYLNFQFKF